jgi:hypothetical protein
MIGTFGVVLTLPGLLMVFEADAPWWFRGVGFGLASIVVAPSIAFICGVGWCRIIVGLLSTIFLLFWSMSPFAQHSIDRTAAFWCFWAMGEVMLLATVVASFTRVSEAPEWARASR